MTTGIAHEIKALTFDVFGTVVDWRSSVIREGEQLNQAKGLKRSGVCRHGAAHIVVTHLGILDSQMVVYGRFAYLPIEDFKIGPIKPNALFSFCHD